MLNAESRNLSEEQSLAEVKHLATIMQSLYPMVEGRLKKAAQQGRDFAVGLNVINQKKAANSRDS